MLRSPLPTHCVGSGLFLLPGVLSCHAVTAMTVPWGKIGAASSGIFVAVHPVELEIIDEADHLARAVRQNRFEGHRLAAQVHVRLEILEPRRPATKDVNPCVAAICPGGMSMPRPRDAPMLVRMVRYFGV
jgi:hypothetical protein